MPTVSKGKNQQYIKEQNRALILKLICTNQCVSRVDIARKTGLNKMTVTNIINELIFAGFIKEGIVSDTTGVGRKPIGLLPCDDGAYSVGIYVSRDYIKASLINLNAVVISEYEAVIGIGETADSLIDKILKSIDRIIQTIDKSKILGIGLACIGPLDIKNGILLSPTDFYGIKNVYLKKIIEEKTGFIVYVNNDMNAAAIAEQLYGKGRDKSNFIYLGITNGIGSGIITNDSLYIGEEGYSGEIGHVSINFDGPVCSCGNKGCLEAYASIPVILQKAHEYMNCGGKTALKNAPDFSFRDIISCAENKDEYCQKTIESMCFHISTALVSVINMLDNEIIYIGHDGALGGETLTKCIEKYINEKIIFKYSKYVKVEVSAFGEQSPVIGSGILVFDKLFSEKLLLNH